jgi:NCAIR mutase (PurE)-related protein
VRHMPFEDLGFAKVDHHRALRHGMPEVIFAEGKTSLQVVEIAGQLIKRNKNVLATRVRQNSSKNVTRRASTARMPVPGASGVTAPSAGKGPSPSSARAPATSP